MSPNTPSHPTPPPRYCYRNQPEAVQFNLVMLANALLAVDLIPRQGAEEVLVEYSQVGQPGRGQGATGNQKGVLVHELQGGARG